MLTLHSNVFQTQQGGLVLSRSPHPTTTAQTGNKVGIGVTMVERLGSCDTGRNAHPTHQQHRFPSSRLGKHGLVAVRRLDTLSLFLTFQTTSILIKMTIISIFSNQDKTVLYAIPKGFIGPNMVNKDIAYLKRFEGTHQKEWNYIISTNTILLYLPIFNRKNQQ